MSFITPPKRDTSTLYMKRTHYAESFFFEKFRMWATSRERKNDLLKFSVLIRARVAVPPAVKNRPEKNRQKNRQPPNFKSKPPILTASFSVVSHKVPPVQNIVQ